ncbi:MAG: hypothetical protein AMXMBFR36_03280 [Acidobacteriota bacterium]
MTAPSFARSLALALALAALSRASVAAPFEASGFLRAAAARFEAPVGFLDGGFGKLEAGAASGESDEAIGEARLALDWEPAVGWRFFVHGVARRDAAAVAPASGSGLLEAFLEHRRGWGEGNELVVLAGQFFLPVSRENVGALWTSPYSLTLSALNAWVAEEVRPIGVDAAWRRTTTSEHRVEAAATLFGGNDTAGTLLAWRGFALHDRPTPTTRFVPLPAIAVLPEQFPEQSGRGSRAFGSDLDGRPGFAGRLRWEAPGGRALVQASGFVNRGDRDLHGDEYAWDTDVRWLAGETDLPLGLRLVAEWASGETRMGFAPPGERSPARVDVTFDASYALLTRRWGPVRATVRYDAFETRDRDATAGDDNRERGDAWTVALLADAGEHWRFGVELVELDADRPAARAVDGDDPDGRSLRLEARFGF